ncbi:MAG TPA: lytic transglycosylase domain-containing protein [Dissulfurispiraceae bacterium]|nr:lytic transglycosylase domain-containing protein [Dissulfurispiraceae bacterium]
MKHILVIACFLCSASGVHADIYKHISEDGVIFFSNTSSGPASTIVIKERKVPLKSNDERNPVYSGGVSPKVTDLSKAGTGLAQKVSYVQKPGDFSSARSLETIHATVDEKARLHSIDPKLVKAVIRAESNWNPYAVSPKGALGLMQLMPSTAALLGVENPFDPIQNIDGGVRYLKHMIERFNGNLTLALAAYNAGPKLVEKRGMVPSIPETVAYVRRVLEYYNGEQGINLSVDALAIQKEIRKEFRQIKKVILEDGTLLFTNS